MSNAASFRAIGLSDPHAPRGPIESRGERAARELCELTNIHDFTTLPDSFLADAQAVIDENAWPRVTERVAALIVQARNAGKLRHPHRSYSGKRLSDLPLTLES